MPSQTPYADDDDLQQALLAADAASPQAVPSITAGRLLTAARRRRQQSVQVRTAFAAACIAVTAIALVRIGPTTPQHPEAPTSSAVASRGPSAPSLIAKQLRAELASLQREAAMQQQVVDALNRARQLPAHQPEAIAASPSFEPSLAAQEAARSAAISLQYAVIVEQESADPHRAIQEYQRVSQRFPGTTWAALAAASLERMSARNERTKL